jgi:arsenate reductase
MGVTVMSGKRTVVLFLCTANIARSQMAEAFLKRIGGDRFEVHSAGLEPGDRIHPLTCQVMNEIGYDLSGQQPKSLKRFFGMLLVDFVIFVCHRAEANCPYLWPTALGALTWPFEDPSVFQGNLEERLEKFREVRDRIEQQIRSWIADSQ